MYFYLHNLRRNTKKQNWNSLFTDPVYVSLSKSYHLFIILKSIFAVLWGDLPTCAKWREKIALPKCHVPTWGGRKQHCLLWLSYICCQGMETVVGSMVRARNACSRGSKIGLEAQFWHFFVWGGDPQAVDLLRNFVFSSVKLKHKIYHNELLL